MIAIQSCWAVQLCSPEGCRILAGGNTPGKSPTVLSRPGGALEPAPKSVPICVHLWLESGKSTQGNASILDPRRRGLGYRNSGHKIQNHKSLSLNMPLRHFPTFPSLKKMPPKVNILLYSQAFGSLQLKSNLSQIKLKGHEKIPQILSAPLIVNHWQIRQKPSKKPCKINPKNRCFCTSINRRLRGGRGANRQKSARFSTNWQIALNSPFSPKPPFVTRCAPTALNLNCGKLKAKKSRFFSGHFVGKSLVNQAKTCQKMLQKCRFFGGNTGVLSSSSNKQKRSMLMPSVATPQINVLFVLHYSLKFLNA
jgi:hypothetical protein